LNAYLTPEQRYARPLLPPAAAGKSAHKSLTIQGMNDSTTPSTDGQAARPALPDHLSIDPRSPHYAPTVLEHAIGIRLNGKERFDVEEYCVSEAWVKVPAGKTVDRKGRPLLIKIKGAVEAFYR
jgi:Protein of unknown function (DUF3297)